MDQQNIQETPSGVLKKFPQKNLKGMLPFIVGSLLVVLVGVGTGYLISGRQKGSISSPSVPGSKSDAKEAGIADESTFSDTAAGDLEEGGVDGEGTHHLVREGGASQNVYLTSTVIDLDSFTGKKVQVWGQTIAGQKAGWLMDVGKIKVVE
ncbi:hypothetical protein ACFL1Q_02050 [Patescibacteria group bacterium]